MGFMVCVWRARPGLLPAFPQLGKTWVSQKTFCKGKPVSITAWSGGYVGLGISWALGKTKQAGPRLDRVEGAGWHQDKVWDPAGRWWWPRPLLAWLVVSPRVLGLISAGHALQSGQRSWGCGCRLRSASSTPWWCPCCASCGAPWHRDGSRNTERCFKVQRSPGASCALVVLGFAIPSPQPVSQHRG